METKWHEPCVPVFMWCFQCQKDEEVVRVLRLTLSPRILRAPRLPVQERMQAQVDEEQENGGRRREWQVSTCSEAYRLLICLYLGSNLNESLA